METKLKNVPRKYFPHIFFDMQLKTMIHKACDSYKIHSSKSLISTQQYIEEKGFLLLSKHSLNLSLGTHYPEMFRTAALILFRCEAGYTSLL